MSADSQGYEEVNYIKYLEQRVRELELEVGHLRGLIAKYKEDIEYYKSQIDKLLAPPLIEATFIQLLPDRRAIVKSSTGPTLIVHILDSVDISKLRPGTPVALNQRGSTIVDILPQREDPYVKAMEVVEKPKTRYIDIGGLNEQVKELREVVELPLRSPELFKAMGIEPPKGVLLYGPPGCGKTLLARAVAGESNATFIRLVASELAQKFIGEGARLVRELFSLARRKAPAIVLIDEIDAIGAKRLDVGTTGEREIHRTLTQLLAELDGFDPLDRVKVIATTNRIDILDPALLRPGRFDKLIEVPPPDLRGRVEIFKVHTRKMPLHKDVDLFILAVKTEGATGADIKAICTEAGLNAIRNGQRVVTMEDFDNAIARVLKKRFRPYTHTSSSSSKQRQSSLWM
ncbi:MAG: proteasome-activating nucleotidase [Thermoprotei archaeon]|nr:MAG: proteasome-activating nucleotidase [Thermoprotei archaeon]